MSARAPASRWAVAIGRCVAAGATTCLLVSPVLGSLGGPDLVEVLGWDPADRKVYVAQHYRGESGYPPAIASFDLKSASPGRRVVLSWSVGTDGKEYDRRARQLRSRLQPLPATPAASMFTRTQVVGLDTVEVAGIRWPRYRILLQRLDNDWPGTLEVRTYRDPSVRVLSLRPIPGEKLQLGIVSFLGIPYEGGYETQTPVLLGNTPDTTRVEWSPFRR